jgi:hypothetical protein
VPAHWTPFAYVFAVLEAALEMAISRAIPDIGHRHGTASSESSFDQWTTYAPGTQMFVDPNLRVIVGAEANVMASMFVTRIEVEQVNAHRSYS